MIYFIGNCQADFVCRILADRGYDTAYRVQASPLTLPSHSGGIPQSLADLNETHDIESFMYHRTLRNQFQPIPAGKTPQCIVLSMFHENVPLFVNDSDGSVFFMDTKILTEKPELMEWTQANCRMFKPNPATYLNRYGDLLIRLRADYPETPIVVLSRLTHQPAFGPDPVSYLEGWGSIGAQAEQFYPVWTSAIPNLHIISMDNVFGGIWRDLGGNIESLCPFLKIKLEEKDEQITGLYAMRDIEHIGPMPDRLADKLETFFKTGTIDYAENETIVPEWTQPWSISKPDDDTIFAKLASGANYQSAEAIASFFLDLQRDHTPLLVQARKRMPVCHMSLHMVRMYSRIWRNPELAIWCEAQIDAARLFLGNGEQYQDTYIERVEGIKDWVLGQ